MHAATGAHHVAANLMVGYLIVFVLLAVVYSVRRR